jgi:hypothetical protein
MSIGAGRAEQPAVKCLAERPEKRSGRSQASRRKGNAAAFFQAGTSTRGTERTEREQGTVAAWSAWWFWHAIHEPVAMCLLANLMNQMATNEIAKEDKSRKHDDDLKPFLPGHAGFHVVACLFQSDSLVMNVISNFLQFLF